MDFADITDITIPEGSVEKITETVGGRVLWQKNTVVDLTKTHWEYVVPTKTDSYRDWIYSLVDTGEGIEVFTSCEGSYYLGTRLHLSKEWVLKDRKTLWRGTALASDDLDEIDYLKLSSDEQAETTEPLAGQIARTREVSSDIDPVSKVWCCVASDVYAVSSKSPTKWQIAPEFDTEHRAFSTFCCWSPEINKFCVLGRNGSYLVDLNGNITGNKYTEIVSTTNTVPELSARSLCWSGKLGLWIACTGLGGGSTDNNQIHISNDGLTWEKLTHSASGIPSSAILRAIVWIPSLEIFVALSIRGSNDTLYISKSSNGRTWEYVTSLTGGTDTNIGKLVWSASKNMLLVTGEATSYITRDLNDWVEMPYPDGWGTNATYDDAVICSSSFNTFIMARCSHYSSGNKFAKLVF